MYESRKSSFRTPLPCTPWCAPLTIFASAWSRTMGIDFSESPTPISYGEVPLVPPPGQPIMPNEAAKTM